ncbi:hypothetical protein NpNSSI1_00009975 [Neofusicoccum parvum]|nr:hypothetical protein NpNSSI1_00009975 [Neofusicoccum parvum]
MASSSQTDLTRGPPPLGLEDVQTFYLAYLTKEYSPRSITDHELAPGFKKSRWLELGQWLQTNLMSGHNPEGGQMVDGCNDLQQVHVILAEASVPPAGRVHFIAIVTLFGIKGRFSRLRKKLDRTAQWGVLAARLLHDQDLIQGIFGPGFEGFRMHDHPVEEARRNVQTVADSKFSYIKDMNDFKVKQRALLLQHIPLRKSNAQHLMEINGPYMFNIVMGTDVKTSIHHHREHIDLEDLNNVTEGEALVRSIELTRICGHCEAEQLIQVELVIAAHDDLADGNDVPPAYISCGV